MKVCLTRLSAPLLMGAAMVIVAPSAQAVSMQECGDMYQAAKAEGTLKGMSWNEFRKAYCSADASAATPAPAPAPPAAKTATPATAPAAAAPAASTPKAAPASTVAGNPVFPTAVSPKYASESAGKARMHTCLDQYNANKATNGNGGLKWIEKGGGYYSQCNKRLQP